MSRRFAGIGLIFAGGLLLGHSRAAAPSEPEALHPFHDSVLLPDGRHTVVVRRQLSAEELAAPRRFSISLRMRHYAEFLARVQAGQRISRQEMESKYLPARSNFEDICAWLEARGFEITLRDLNHTQVFAKGSVAQAAAAFAVTFARVADGGEEFTSAVSAPSLPERFSRFVLSINGLQPHVRARPAGSAPPFPQGNAPQSNVAQLAAAIYHIPAGLTGAGQTIATIGIQSVSDSDLALYWSTYDIPHTAPITHIAVDGGGSGFGREDTGDVEAASSVAPGAQIRLYESPDAFSCFAQILNDQASDPTLTVVNSSYAFNYLVLGPAASQSQTFAQLAAAGVTVVNASGDEGSAGGLAYPASDPNVTGVGGTSIDRYGNETAWASPITAPGSPASGGGFSPVFARPSWQNVTPWGVAGPITQRMGPDVAAIAGDGSFIFDGAAAGLGGTSESSPIFAGIVALLNQARSNVGAHPLGLLGPKIYPLLGSGAFNPIDDGGSNGVYAAGPGYNLVTGLGSPNVPNLAAALSSIVSFTSGPAGIQIHNPGDTVTFRASASGAGPISYQWQWQVAGASFWVNLTDGTGVSGSGTSSLILTATPAFNGASFQCLASNSSGTDTSTMATLIVENPVAITTLAGVPGQDSPITGSLSQARFGSLQGIALDPMDNIYLVDFGYQIISEVASGEVSTLAGSPNVTGSADGTGPAAQFDLPWGLAVDSAGNVFVADSGNDVIRKITPAGVVTTFAGLAGAAGSADGTGSAARFNSPYGVAVDKADNLFVADTGNITIRKITPAGVVTTFAGTAGAPGGTDGTGSAARFYYPYDVAVDNSGNVFVADTLACRICKITPAGVVTTIAGTSGTPGNADGVGTEAQFNNPSGLTVDAADNVFVADSGNNVIKEITPTGVVTTIAGSGSTGSADGLGPLALFNYPVGIAVDASDRLFIADTNNFTIRVAQAGAAQPAISSQPQSQTTGLGGTATFTVAAAGPGPLAYQWYFEPPGGISFSAIPGATGPSYAITDVQAGGAGSYAVLVTNPGGAIASEPAVLTLAVAPAFTAQPANQDVAPGSSATFSAAAAATTPLTYQWYFDGTPISGATRASYTVDDATSADAGTYTVVATDAGGSVTSSGATLAVQLGEATTTGSDSITTLAGTAGVQGSLDGSGGSASFFQPSAVAVDGAGNVYIADTNNSTIRRISPGGVVATIAGTAGVAGSADGSGAAAQFNHPYGIAVDRLGNLYVSDTFNGTIRKISPAGAVMTLAGTAGVTGSADGAGALASFNTPAGIAVDGSGNIYVADSGNNTIRMITPAGVVTTFAGTANTNGYLNGTGAAARFYDPCGIAVDGAGNVYVADTSNCAIRMITPAGVVTGLAGAFQDAGSADGTGGAAQFSSPIGISVDGSGNVYVADTSNCTLRRITPAGVVTTLAGGAGAIGSADGTGSMARFAYPTGIAIGPSGAIYVADAGNDTIRLGAPGVDPAPVIAAQPASQGVAGGGVAVFTVTASGAAPLAYQWSFNGAAISGATSSTYTINGVAPANAGSYTVTVTNAAGSAMSNGAVLAVPSGGAPVIALQPRGQTVALGSTVLLTASASGGATAFQWYLNGIPISGATGPMLVLSNASTSTAGNYLCLVSNAYGSTLSGAAVVTVTAMGEPGRLVNLSILGNIEPRLSMGFVVGGTGSSGFETLLIRAVGPSIGPGTAFNVPNVLPDPTVAVVEQSNQAMVASNSGWGMPFGNAQAVQAADSATGAFPLTNTNSLDSALVAGFPPVVGGYSATVAGESGGSGSALTEIYDDTPAGTYTGTTPRLINLSCLTQITTGGTLDAGFVVGGTTSETVLIRVSGPALSEFGIMTGMPDPQLEITPLGSSSTALASNAGWAGSSQIASFATSVGAFTWTNAASLDSAVALTLPPGPYIVQLNSVSGAGGTVLVELYEVP